MCVLHDHRSVVSDKLLRHLLLLLVQWESLTIMKVIVFFSFRKLVFCKCFEAYFRYIAVLFSPILYTDLLAFSVTNEYGKKKGNLAVL